MKDIELYVETLSNKFDIDDDEFCERDEYDAGYVEGWEHACQAVLTYLSTKENALIPEAKYIYETLKTIRYDKNSGGTLSPTQLKNEFTDYALRDIATKLHYQLTGKGETSNAI